MREHENRPILRVSRTERLEPSDVIGRCFETGAEAVLFEDGGLPAAFFDLSTGVAGDLLRKVTNYRLRVAAVVPDFSRWSSSFQDFAREVSRGATFRFFDTEHAALEWLKRGG